MSPPNPAQASPAQAAGDAAGTAPDRPPAGTRTGGAGRPGQRAARSRRADGRPVLSARAGAVLGVVVVLLMILALPAKAYITQRARISSLEDQVAWHTQRLADLSAAHKRWKQEDYIEAQARSRLHYVRPGQVGYVVLTQEAEQQAEVTTTRPQPRVPQGAPWWSAIWSTVVEVAEPKPRNPAPSAPPPAQPAQHYGG